MAQIQSVGHPMREENVSNHDCNLPLWHGQQLYTKHIRHKSLLIKKKNNNNYRNRQKESLLFWERKKTSYLHLDKESLDQSWQRNKTLCLCSITLPWNEPTGFYLFKVNNENIRNMYEIYSKLIRKTPEWCQWRRFGVFLVNFEQANTAWE